MRTKGQRWIGAPLVEAREAVGWGCLIICGLSLCSSFTGDLDGRIIKENAASGSGR